MKRIITIILAVFYISLSSGAMLSLHYCEGNFESIAINNEAYTCCCGSGDIMSSCCENKEFSLEVNTDEYLVLTSNDLIKKFVQIGLSNSEIEYHNPIEIEEQLIVFDELFLLRSEPIWLLNCSFTFYG